MISPPAMQAGRYVAKHILNRTERRPFRYRDKGALATIGRRAAVGQIGRFRFRGFIGWLVWLAVHIYYLIGFENRVQVLLRWSWYYVRLDRPVRVILRADPPPDAPARRVGLAERRDRERVIGGCRHHLYFLRADRNRHRTTGEGSAE